MGKEVLAVDIDEVLFPFMPEFVKFHNQEYGTQLTAGDFYCYDFDAVLGLPTLEVTNRIVDFIQRDWLHVPPIEAAEESIIRLADRFDLAVVTARERLSEKATRVWLDNYFIDLIGSHNFLGHYGASIEKPRTKVSVCKELGAVALIDDSIRHTSECPREGVEGVLFGDYAWNQAPSLPDGVTRCEDWEKTVVHFGC
jgi:5'(3')-deoxyribonucleotidase